MTQADEIDILPDAVGDAVNVKGASDADIKKALLDPLALVLRRSRPGRCCVVLGPRQDPR